MRSNCMIFGAAHGNSLYTIINDSTDIVNKRIGNFCNVSRGNYQVDGDYMEKIAGKRGSAGGYKKNRAPWIAKKAAPQNVRGGRQVQVRLLAPISRTPHMKIAR